MSAPDPKPLNIAIIGAGPVGLALGLLLAQRCPHTHVSLFDARAADADVSGDPRTLALALGSVQLLQTLGAWPEQDSQPILAVQVSQEAAALGLPGLLPRVHLEASGLKVPRLGAVLAYGRLVPALQAAWDAAVAKQPKRLHTRYGHPVRGLKAQTAGVEVDAGVADHFDLAVVAEGGVFMRQEDGEANGPADGAASPDPTTWQHDYGQTAWVGTVMLRGGTPGLAIERFSRQGPAALLPLPPNAASREAGCTRASLVWCVNAADDPVAPLSDQARLAVLNTLFPSEVGQLVSISALKRFALGLKAHKTLVQDNCIVRIGNAAQTLHPVAGQGLNLGLRDAYALADALSLMQRHQQTLAQVLREVQWQRAPDRLGMIAVTDFLARSFTWQFPGLATARGLGLMAVEHLPLLKQMLARQMMFGRR